MLDACVVHEFGCSCPGVCMRLCECSEIVLCMLGFCMLHACFVHAFGMLPGVCLRLCACFVLVLCVSVASTCLLLDLYMRLVFSSCDAAVVDAPDAC